MEAPQKLEMTERLKILARIREALAVPAPVPGHTHEPMTGGKAAQPGASGFRQWLPVVGDAFEDRLESFRKNSADLKTEFQLVETREELGRRLLALRDAEGWTRVGSHSGDLTDGVVALLGLPVCLTDRSYQTAELESCSVGITQCDGLVAQTGSVLVTSRSAGGRALSVLPPHHVVLARRAQLLRDLPEAFALLRQTYAPNYPSFISLISGPSRTGDIERILVLGAHGPRKLTILCH